MPVHTDTHQSSRALLTEWSTSGAASIPVLPALATRVISLASDPESTLTQLSRVISKDQVLTTRLLSLANSAYSAPAAEITSVSDAVMRVGSSGVRNLAVTVCFTSRMQDPDIYGAKGAALVDHGIGAAYLARLIAEESDEDPEEAFLCGLLHDIGKLVLLKWYHDRLRQTGIRCEQIDEVIEQWHPTVAALAFRRWNLPVELDEPVMHHHDYTKATARRPLAAVVYLANRLSHRYGFGCDADGSDLADDPAVRELGLTTEWLASLDVKAPGLFSVARQILG